MLNQNDMRQQLNRAARAKWSMTSGEFEAMRERLYRAVLTASSQDGMASGLRASNSSGWMAAGFSFEPEAEADERATGKRGKVAGDLTKVARYQPTARDLDVWLDDLALLNGFGLKLEADARERLAQWDAETAKLEKRLSGLMRGTIPATFEIREKRVGEIQLELVVRGRTRKGRAELVEQYTGLGRKVLGVLKGAAHHFVFGGARDGTNKWQYAAKWGGIETALLARQLHDEAIYWALAGEKFNAEIKEHQSGSTARR